jgi:PadR family transcriptional regulator PadR
VPPPLRNSGCGLRLPGDESTLDEARESGSRLPALGRVPGRLLLSLASQGILGCVDSEALKGHLDLLLLVALSGEPLHGYGALARLREISEGTFDLPEGTIYPALHRLQRAGLLDSNWQVVERRRRRVYRLTARGQEELLGRRAAWQRFSYGVTRALEASG